MEYDEHVREMIPYRVEAIMGTKLEVQQGSGDFETWQTAYTISAPEIVTFRWSTSERGVTSAQWQITDAPKRFSEPSYTIIASGVLAAAPAPGHVHVWSIDFASFLSLPAPTTAKHYYVRLRPFRERQWLEPSPSVTISYVAHFDMNRFEQNLKSQLGEKIIGYSYAIFEHLDLARAGAGGFAVWPDVPQSPDRRMTMMSMSKTITATAVMKLMEEMHSQGTDITVDSPIAPYLPSNWFPHGPHVSEMTFRHLLTHTSGLRAVSTPGDPDPDTYTNLRGTIHAGAQDADFGAHFYANANFCLFRIIIPYMAATIGTASLSALAGGDDDADAKATGKAYVLYVKMHVLGPIGLAGADPLSAEEGIDVVPTGPLPYTRYYPDWSDPTVSFSDPIDDTATLRTGAGYWYMSAKEFAKFIAGLRNGLIVSDETLEIMKPETWRVGQTTARGLGMYGTLSTVTQGKYWDHNGGTAGAYADWMIFPNGVTAVILVNSGISGAEPQDRVRSAFDSAWVV